MRIKMDKKTKKFSGSYDERDCEFLLEPIQIECLSVEEKERRLQAGVHYSEMISKENRPNAEYERLFLETLAQHKFRLAKECLWLAREISQQRGGVVTLLSLARAGTPIGVLLHRALRDLLGCDSQHYSISIIRDKGLDEAALRHVLSQRRPESIMFVDGWTAKGTITRELKTAVAQWNSHAGINAQIPDELCVVADVSGTADLCATMDDYVIPSGILNSTASGLVSRTISPKDQANDEFHKCVFFEELIPYDLTYLFIDEVYLEIKKIFYGENENDFISPKIDDIHEQLMCFIDKLMSEFKVSDINKVKPGIAEATRVMLRRIPDVLIVKDIENKDIAHLLLLAKEKGITVMERANMPFNAVAIIKTLD